MSLGFRRDDLNTLSVIVAYGNNRSHKCSGKLSSVLLRPDTKLFLKVWMHHSAAFCWCIPGGNNWYVTLLFVSKSFMLCDASLSNQCVRGLNPRWVRYLYILVYVRRMSVPVWLLIGSASIAFASYTYKTNIHLCPLLEATRNLPIWSVYT